ncbi:glycosyltransferase family 2 protein [Clostridium felsineum]|uniref:Glycosyltransferase 2-like domain-containing protein n=1 Tax=Clostridium felsineum TaxID=36839 RepID=A0A1S8KXI8_9CLOT|nr:glycosyltransferase family 2 protein [Clostridium felsineum]URZ09151.1 hypothetical protein CLROS_045670 [Clostridium felsineum]URZ13838.1 hypothetical protein CROST_046160 [Clostridium felsineum]
MNEYYDNYLQLDEILKQIKSSIEKKSPYSLVRFGHGEMHVVAHKIFPKHRNSIYFGYYYKYAGITDLSDDISLKLLNALKKATLVGSEGHISYNKELFDKVIAYYNLHLPSVCSAWIAQEMIKSKKFFDLLKPLKVIIIGRRAREGAEKFKALGIDVVTTMGHEGFSEISNTIDKISNIDDFDIALVSAGVPATIMCPDIAEKTGKIAIDFGHALDILIDGDNFDHEKKVATFYNKINSEKITNLKKRNSEITIFMPSFNPGKFLRTALKSIFWQTYQNWRLILVDDCSTDNSLETVKDLLKDPRITLIKNPNNMGQSKAQNAALELITTPYCVQLDSDDWLFPDTLEKLLNTFSTQPEDVAVVSGNFIIVNTNSEDLKRAYDEKKEFSIRKRKGRFFKDKYDFLASNTTLCPRCYRTNALKKVGGWPTDVPYEGRHMEDRLILLRLAEYYNFYWIDETLYVHRRHNSNSTNNLEAYNYIIEWEDRYVLKRWGDKYEPLFKIDEGGWKYIESIIPK